MRKPGRFHCEPLMPQLATCMMFCLRVCAPLLGRCSSVPPKLGPPGGQLPLAPAPQRRCSPASPETSRHAEHHHHRLGAMQVRIQRVPDRRPAVLKERLASAA